MGYPETEKRGSSDHHRSRSPSPAPTYRSRHHSMKDIISIQGSESVRFSQSDADMKQKYERNAEDEEFNPVEEPFDTIHPHYVPPAQSEPAPEPAPVRRRPRNWSPPPLRQWAHWALTLILLLIVIWYTSIALGINLYRSHSRDFTPAQPQPQNINIIINEGQVTPTSAANETVHPMIPQVSTPAPNPTPKPDLQSGPDPTSSSSSSSSTSSQNPSTFLLLESLSISAGHTATITLYYGPSPPPSSTPTTLITTTSGADNKAVTPTSLVPVSAPLRPISTPSISSSPSQTNTPTAPPSKPLTTTTPTPSTCPATHLHLFTSSTAYADCKKSCVAGGCSPSVGASADAESWTCDCDAKPLTLTCKAKAFKGEDALVACQTYCQFGGKEGCVGKGTEWKCGC